MTRQIRGIGLGLIAFYLVAIAVNALRGKGIDWTLIAVGSSLLACGGAVAGMTPKLRTATLKALQDPEATPYLVETLDSFDDSLIPTVVEVLRTTLPTLDETDAARFSNVQLDALKTYLTTRCKDADFFAKAIGALRYIGRGKDLLWIDMIAKGQSSTLSRAEADKAKVLALAAASDLRLRLSKQKIDALQTEADSAAGRNILNS